MTSSETTRDIDSIISGSFSESLPQLPDEDFLHLVAPITLKELTESRQKLRKGKAPGVDGLPVELYSTFWDLLEPFLCAVLNNILTTDTDYLPLSKEVESSQYKKMPGNGTNPRVGASSLCCGRTTNYVHQY
ncbi:hypothetical protein HPB48_010038 [Haemaphysalis longicornis]|uniref:Endonuclease-reverse transcriptase n=1 Tax=Haemaphysalis longicornis TaxID=44386 RepID=A0A9J6GT45_HAELO|nr:hypothetical protein HPB48_010038 [Haemaphysalis longicornis]